jgi:methionine-rich copper-binding protein CopC
VAVIGLDTPRPAWAHNALISTSPGAGKMVAEPPGSVVLTFNEPAIATGTKVLVSGPDGSATTGDPRLVDNTVEQDLKAELPAGDYTVDWRVTSVDGHPINGTFSFTVRTGSDAAVSPSAAATPTASPTASPTVSPTSATTTPLTSTTPVAPPQDGIGDEPGGGSGWLWLLVIVPVALAVALGWRFSRR